MKEKTRAIQIEPEHKFCWIKIMDKENPCFFTGHKCSEYPKCDFVAVSWIRLGYEGLTRLM